MNVIASIDIDSNTDTAADNELWYKDAIVYQLHVKAFADSNNDGIGDFAGLTEKLDYLQDLGVTTLWLLPFYPSPQRDDGYDIADYGAINPDFGTMKDFRRFITEAKRRGLRVITELVVNHTSDQHAWFVESRQSRDNPKADWYVWADAKDDGNPPNNWLSIFGGSAWQWDTRRRQYYLHNFLASQPDLNFHNPEVQDALVSLLSDRRTSVPELGSAVAARKGFWPVSSSYNTTPRLNTSLRPSTRCASPRACSGLM